MAKNSNSTTPGASLRFMTFEKPSPGLMLRREHDMGTGNLHIVPSVRGFGAIKSIDWDEKDVRMRIEGSPSQVVLRIEVVQ